MTQRVTAADLATARSAVETADANLKAAQAQKEVNEKRGVNSDAAGLVMLLKILTMKDSSLELKRMIAQEFDSVEDIMAGIET